jgi:hypothetical protein
MRRQAMMALLLGWLVAGAALAQEQEPPREQINLSVLPPPPPPEEPAKPTFVPPEKVFLPAASIAVVLDTPISTRITRKGAEVVFLTSESIRLADGLELPPGTRILATVAEARKPGLFGRPGAMKIKVERFEVDAQSAPIVARLEGVDADAGKITSDSSRTADLYTLATWSLSGTLLGAHIGGGKGALIGSGAGAAAAILMAMSRRGPDLYLEPGTPFAVVLEEPLELSGAAAYAAQLQYQKTHRRASREKSEEELLDSASDPGKPKLQRRPDPPEK